MVSEERLKELERLCKEATDGPWEKRGHGVVRHRKVDYTIAYVTMDKNSALISESRTAIPELIKCVRELKAALEGSWATQRIAQLEREADFLACNSLVAYYGGRVPAEEVQRLRREAQKVVQNGEV